MDKLNAIRTIYKFRGLDMWFIVLHNTSLIMCMHVRTFLQRINLYFDSNIKRNALINKYKCDIIECYQY